MRNLVTIAGKEIRDGMRNRWIVAITHPLSAGSPNDPDVRPGGRSALAFAVWEGGSNEVGSRKAWAPWVTVEVDE